MIRLMCRFLQVVAFVVALANSAVAQTPRFYAGAENDLRRAVAGILGALALR